MRKIRIIEHISLDGVIQGPGGPNEDDYPHGGWSVPFSDPAAGEAIVAAYSEAFDLLLGRRTYDIFSGYWPKAEKSPMTDSLNAATKYVATHRPDTMSTNEFRRLAAKIDQHMQQLAAQGVSEAHAIINRMLGV
jgi:dihydrofolate reductase